MRDTERQRHRQREKQALCREPDVGFDPRTPGSRPGPKAGTKPQSHPGIPYSLTLYALLKICTDYKGALVALSVQRPTFDSGSGHDLRVLGWSPTSGSMLSMESACLSLSLPLLLPMCSLKQNLYKEAHKFILSQLWWPEI